MVDETTAPAAVAATIGVDEAGTTAPAAVTSAVAAGDETTAVGAVGAATIAAGVRAVDRVEAAATGSHRSGARTLARPRQPNGVPQRSTPVAAAPV